MKGSGDEAVSITPNTAAVRKLELFYCGFFGDRWPKAASCSLHPVSLREPPRERPLRIFGTKGASEKARDPFKGRYRPARQF
jgi:hypothetical protein